MDIKCVFCMCFISQGSLVSSSYLNIHPIPTPTHQHTGSLCTGVQGEGVKKVYPDFLKVLRFSFLELSPSSSRLPQKNFELDLWASLKFTLFLPAIIQVCRVNVTVAQNPNHLAELLKKMKQQGGINTVIHLF